MAYRYSLAGRDRETRVALLNNKPTCKNRKHASHANTHSDTLPNGVRFVLGSRNLALAACRMAMIKHNS